ncbi:MAG: metal ABC transporter permease [Candidatus Moranbacteria bacterium]|nr:metal ABC transporter permease [Candidatus Moranbacteria bacterium]
MFENIFQYGFIVRGLEAGVIVAIIAPLIGIFLVLRRYSLIADTLAHVSLAGIAIGLLSGINPVLTAIGTAVAASLGIEKLRSSKRLFGESALAIFLSGSLAFAVVILGLADGFNASLLNYLFGSIVTVSAADVRMIFILALVVILILGIFYKQLVYVTFDEEAAKISGVPTRLVNSVLMVLAALTVALAIPIVGVLLISALIVIPVVTALQFKKSFARTIIYAEAVSLFSVIAGILASFYFDLAAGGAIVLVMLAVFAAAFVIRRR